MAISKVDNGYKVDLRPNGRAGKRYRKTFDTKGEAVKYEKFIIGQYQNKEWLDAPIDKRPLSELIDKWYFYHGQNLKEGKTLHQKLHTMCGYMGNPLAYQITKKFFLDYRQHRLGKIVPKTANLELQRLKGVFSVLIAAGDYIGENPLKGMSKVKEATNELSFLTSEDITLLLSHLSGDMAVITRICLSTGARWSEGQNLTGSQVLSDRLTFVNTKNGKNRTVPISQELRQMIPNKSGRLFADCYTDFIKVLKSTEIELPKGQASHVLRHTFASHFVMNGGNILTLQKILGHSSITMTMKYAHLAPDHLIEAVRFNPLVNY